MFIIDNTIATILVIAGYSGILFFGDSSQFLHPQTWAEKFSLSDSEWVKNILNYSNNLFQEMFGFKGIKITSILFAFTIIYNFAIRTSNNKYLLLLCAFMFFSPVLIVIIHKVYPFARTFYYLIFPCIFLLGFTIQAISSPLLHYLKVYYLKKLIIPSCILISIFISLNSLTFLEKNRSITQWEYHLDWLRKNKLQNVLEQYHEIARTNSGFEFYPTELIVFIGKKENELSNINISILDSIQNQDLLLINRTEKPKYRKGLQDYQFLFEFGDVWIYQSKKIKQ